MICPPLDTPAQRAALAARIAKLQIIYEDLTAGRAIKRFEDQNGEKIEYNTGNLLALEKLIIHLSGCLNPVVARAYRARPIGFIFPRQ